MLSLIKCPYICYLCLCVCLFVYMYYVWPIWQVVDCNSDGFLCPLGCIAYWFWHRLLVDCKVKVREAWNGWQCNTGMWSHNEGRDGRNVTGVQGSEMRAHNKSVTGHTEIQWVHSETQWGVVYSLAWDCCYKLNHQPVCERVTAGVILFESSSPHYEFWKFLLLLVNTCKWLRKQS